MDEGIPTIVNLEKIDELGKTVRKAPYKMSQNEVPLGGREGPKFEVFVEVDDR